MKVKYLKRLGQDGNPSKAPIGYLGVAGDEQEWNFSKCKDVGDLLRKYASQVQIDDRGID